MWYPSEIFWWHSQDISELFSNYSLFLVSLSVCLLAYFLTEIISIVVYLQFWMRYQSEFLETFFGYLCLSVSLSVSYIFSNWSFLGVNFWDLWSCSCYCLKIWHKDISFHCCHYPFPSIFFSFYFSWVSLIFMIFHLFSFRFVTFLLPLFFDLHLLFLSYKFSRTCWS